MNVLGGEGEKKGEVKDKFTIAAKKSVLLRTKENLFPDYAGV
jgi:hypothetical protein